MVLAANNPELPETMTDSFLPPEPPTGPAEFQGGYVAKRQGVHQVLLFACECGGWVDHGYIKVGTNQIRHDDSTDHFKISMG